MLRGQKKSAITTRAMDVVSARLHIRKPGTHPLRGTRTRTVTIGAGGSQAPKAPGITDTCAGSKDPAYVRRRRAGSEDPRYESGVRVLRPRAGVLPLHGELPDFAIQVRALDAERARGFGHAAAMELQNGLHVVVLEALARFLERPASVKGQGVAVETDVGEDVVQPNQPVGNLHGERVQQPPQLREIPAPRQRTQELDTLRRHRFPLNLQRPADVAEENPDETRDVLTPLAQRRQLDAMHGDPALELRRHAFVVPRGAGVDGRHHADVDAL